MSLPAGVDGVTVSSGKPLCLPDGTPYVGKLLFVGPDLVTIGTQDVVLGGTNVVDLAADGTFSVTLAANDVTGMSPTGWTYRVVGVFDNAPGWIRHISLPKATPAVNLADVLVPDPAVGTYVVLVDPTTLLPLAGGTITGNLTVQGYSTLNGGQFNGDVATFGDLRLIGTGKAYRFRRSGSNLDVEGAGVDMILSVWSGGDFTGTQHSYDRYSANAANVQHAGKREYVTALYGGAVHTIDPDAGTASFGGKNGLSAVRLAGFKNTAGAPTNGAWTSGDVVLDSAGAWHLCTAGGSPGTWT